MKRILFAALPLLALACGPTERQYTVDVHNHSDAPYTVLLTKDGPPAEIGWASPEDMNEKLQTAPPKAMTYVEVPPGKSARNSRTGRFNSGTGAILRIYRGSQTPDAMLGISPASALRVDLPLLPGDNDIAIDKTGQASVTR